MKVKYVLFAVFVLVVLYLIMNKREHMDNNIVRKVNKPCAINEDFLDGMCYSKCPEGYVVSSDHRMCQLKQTTSGTTSPNIINNLLFQVEWLINKYNSSYIRNTSSNVLQYNIDEIDMRLSEIERIGFADNRMKQARDSLNIIKTAMKNTINLRIQNRR
jgi:hypothetical protein